MIAVYCLPFYLLVHCFVLQWFIRWTKSIHPHFYKKWLIILICTIYLLLTLSMGIGFLLGYIVPGSFIERIFKQIGNVWLGFSLYIVLVVAVALIIRFFHIRKHVQFSQKKFMCIGLCCILIIALIGTYGMVNARIIRKTPYDITVNKEVLGIDSLNIILIGDLHLGYNIGISQMKQMVGKINQEDADIILIAGDIFDNEYEALESPDELASILASMNSKYGTYAVYGNHDIEEKILAGFTFKSDEIQKADPRMGEFLKKANITLIEDESICIDDSFYIIGRRDSSKPQTTNRKSIEELMDEVDDTKPVIVLDHEPRELQESADAGVDIDLNGHTHKGQIWPATWIVPFFWENPYGEYKVDDMEDIVTSGVGVFGPFMRIDSIAEYCPITVHFKS